jgi:pheromone shutdown protein TraB
LSILTYSQRTLKIIPGGEFITAMREAEKRNIPILMGDEEVEKIISSLKNVGNIKSFISNPFSIIETIKSMTFSITGNHQFVEFGKNDIKNSQWLNILPAFLREKNLVIDTLLLMSPSIIPVLIVSTIATYLIENYESFPFSNYFMNSVDNDTTDYLYQLGDILANIFTFYWALVVVNIFRYVIVERDRIIAARIKNACEQISKEKNNDQDQDQTKDIVCVLGMLHCNGVAKYLLDDE